MEGTSKEESTPPFLHKPPKNLWCLLFFFRVGMFFFGKYFVTDMFYMNELL